MRTRRSRLAAVLRVAKHRENRAAASHEAQMREVESARQYFIAAQNRATPESRPGTVDEVNRQRNKNASSARTAMAAELDLRDQIERSLEERNDMLSAMRYRRTVERIDEHHAKAWANLAAQAAERALDDMAIARWRRGRDS